MTTYSEVIRLHPAQDKGPWECLFLSVSLSLSLSFSIYLSLSLTFFVDLFEYDFPGVCRTELGRYLFDPKDSWKIIFKEINKKSERETQIDGERERERE